MEAGCEARTRRCAVGHAQEHSDQGRNDGCVSFPSLTRPRLQPTRPSRRLAPVRPSWSPPECQRCAPQCTPSDRERRRRPPTVPRCCVTWPPQACTRQQRGPLECRQGRPRLPGIGRCRTREQLPPSDTPRGRVFPALTSSAETSTSGTGKPAAARRARINVAEPDVTAAQRSAGSFRSNARAAGSAITPSKSDSSSCSSSTTAASCCSTGRKSATVSSVRRPWHTRRTSSTSIPRLPAHVVHVRTTAPVESTNVPSILNSTASTRKRMITC